MVFSAGQAAAYAANDPDPAARNDISVEVRAEDQDDLLEQYRALLVQRESSFRITVTLEAKMTSIDQYKPSSVVFNDQDPESWASSACFDTSMSSVCSFKDCEDQDDGLLMSLSNVILYHMYDGHSDQQSIIVNFQERIPDGVDIEIDGMPAEMRDDRTAAKTIGNYPTQTLEPVRTDITVKFIGLHNSDIMDKAPALLQQRLLESMDAFSHNGEPDKGDYLFHHLDGLPDVTVQDPVETGFDEASHTYFYDLPIDFAVDYYSTADMEEEVGAEIDRVLDMLDLEGKSEYEKIKAIHDYICGNTEYEFPQNGDEPPMLKHSAYSALIAHKAVCDGYANLFYRMCLRAGIDARIVYGQGKGDSHSWNIVQLGNLYYDVDCTWDAGSSAEYFLMGHTEFLQDHTPRPSFTEQAFLENYPMSEIRYTPPTFETASLTLGGRIGLNMMINLPDIPDFDYENSYVDFTVNSGESVREDYDPNRKNRDGTLFKFTCYVNAVQMADEIIAVYHYLANGEEQTVSQTYTIEQYLRTLSAQQDATDEEKAMAKATADYGYYVQPYLADVNDWALEGDSAAHARMSFSSASGYSDKVGEILAGIDGPDVEMASDVRSLGLSLLLDTDTSLNLFFYMAPDYAGTVGAAIDGRDAAAEKVSNGKYRVVIPNIGAKNLGKKYTVVVSTDAGDTTVEVSALNYVKIALSNTDPEPSNLEKQAMGALYYYAKAAEALAAAQAL